MKTILSLIHHFINAPRNKERYEEYLRHEYGIEPHHPYDSVTGGGLIGSRYPHSAS